jgi:hypothetical protein
VPRINRGRQTDHLPHPPILVAFGQRRRVVRRARECHLGGERRIEVDPFADRNAEETGRRDADDRRQCAVDADGGVGETRAVGEVPLPQPVADDDGEGAPERVIGGGQRTSDRRRHAKLAEEVRADVLEVHLFAAAAVEGHGHRARVGEADERRARRLLAGERPVEPRRRRRPAHPGLRVAVEVAAMRVGQTLGPSRAFPGHQVQRRGMPHRQGPENCGVDEAEDRRVRANPQRQREHHRHGDDPAAAQLAPSHREIAQHPVEPGENAGRADVLPDRPRVAEAQPGASGIALGRGAHGEVERELLVDLALVAPGEERAAKAAQQRHGELSDRPQHPGDGGGDVVPAGLGFGQAPAAPGGERIDAGAARRVGDFPFGLEQPGLGQPVQRRIERAFLDPQHVVGGLLDEGGDGEPVIGAAPKHFQDQQFERALEVVGAGHSIDG